MNVCYLEWKALWS